MALQMASLLRVDFDVSDLEAVGQLLIVPIAALLQLGNGWLRGLYTGRWRYGSFEEVAALVTAVALTTVQLFFIDLLVSHPRMVPLSATVGGGFIALVLAAGSRYLIRLFRERRTRPSADVATRLLVFGAGEGAERALDAILRDPDSSYVPVALLDDDPEKRKLTVRGIPVVGGREDIGPAASAYGAETLLVAIPSADRELLSDISRRANEIALPVKVMPSVRELLDGPPEVAEIRDISPADLLGRREIDTDVASIAAYVQGKRVLVTGAGGSIGSELCRQLASFDPEELLMLDRDESALHAVKLSIAGHAMMDTPDVVLVDLRDESAVRHLFERRRPQVVFHAAALKHLPMLEQYPAEGVKTNVLATQTLLNLSVDGGVERFVNVSTDKAANPTSVLGYTKRIAEQLTAEAAGRSSGVFLSVRFGNVLGSRGSVLDVFARQIMEGGPVTVTDPEVTRYFMTIAEAVQLVIQAGAIGRDGEVLVFDMGSAVRIHDVAQQLIAQSGREIAIEFRGLRPAEKLHEELFGHHEVGECVVHPMISHVRVPTMDVAELARLSLTGDESAIVDSVRSLCLDGRGARLTLV